MDAPGPSVRIHVGLEDVDDLLADLDRGFARMRTLALKRSPGANP
jgi:cystathionine beta-lyase